MIPLTELSGWGNFPKVNIKEIITVTQDSLHRCKTKIGISRGSGMSYGDQSLNSEYVFNFLKYNKVLEFNANDGFLICESGATVLQILKLIIPKGWVLPVVPGSGAVTIGGAIANDVHGKNHHRQGSFGDHIDELSLLRSDNPSVISCSRSQNQHLFCSTIGGLGLTGIILRAKIRLVRAPFEGKFSVFQERLPFLGLEKLFELFEDSKDRFESIYSWIHFNDGLKIQGFVFRCHPVQSDELAVWGYKKVFFQHYRFKKNLLNSHSIWLFNELYSLVNFFKRKTKEIRLGQLLFPTDFIANWNRFFGKNGLIEYQVCVPHEKALTVFSDIFQKLGAKKIRSTFTVLKAFDQRRPSGLLSFPQPGYNLSMQFANCNDVLFKTLNEIDQLVILSGGRVYLAKDSRLSKENFERMYSKLEEFKKSIDPLRSSQMSQRLGLTQNLNACEVNECGTLPNDK